jgi:ribosomal protein S18 acetylase RimI-like enzyme
VGSRKASTLQQVNYRPYSPQDFTALYAIEELCFQPPFRFGRQYMRRLVARANAATWIAEEEGRMTGFAIAEWTWRAGEGAAYIQTIEVTPEERGRGIGNQLLSRIEDSARAAGSASIWLHVATENMVAVRLYETNGYVFEGRMESYYGSGRAALVFSKPLTLKPDR